MYFMIPFLSILGDPRAVSRGEGEKKMAKKKIGGKKVEETFSPESPRLFLCFGIMQVTF